MSASAKLPVFHIGANKAGSTTLQRALFARHPQILNLAKPHPVPELKRAVDAILAACDGHVKVTASLDVATIQRTWRDSIALGTGGQIPLYSREGLIRQYFYGAPDPQRLPRAILNMSGPARVVLIVRHQTKLIESLYIHKNNMAAYRSPEQWLASQPQRFAYGYRYHEIADIWAQLVGEANIGVFVFEEMVSDSASFARRLCNFIGIDAEIGIQLLSNRHENIRKSSRTQAYARLRSRFWPRSSLGRLLPPGLRQAWRNYLEKGPRARGTLPRDWLLQIEEHYRSDNLKLAERFHVPIRDYGYPM